MPDTTETACLEAQIEALIARPVIFCANSMMMCAGTPEARTIRHKI